MRNRTIRTVLSLLALAALPAAAQVQFHQPPEYLLNAGDVIEVQYRVTPEYNATATVQADGAVTLPLVGGVRVEGLSIKAAESAIQAAAGKRLRDPEVFVLIKDALKPFYTVAGQVAKPGRYDLRGPTTVTEALAQSGWFQEGAKHSQILLVRRVNQELGEVRVLDIKKMLATRTFQEDVRLRSGDMLVAPQSALGKMDRYFRWSGNLGFLAYMLR